MAWSTVSVTAVSAYWPRFRGQVFQSSIWRWLGLTCRYFGRAERDSESSREHIGVAHGYESGRWTKLSVQSGR
jgi:hypothetical protein